MYGAQEERERVLVPPERPLAKIDFGSLFLILLLLFSYAKAECGAEDPLWTWLYAPFRVFGERSENLEQKVCRAL